MVTVVGTTVSGARIDATVEDLGISLSFQADQNGSFTAELPGEAGQIISIIAYDLSSSDQPSEPAFTTVQPESLLFITTGQSVQLQTTGHYNDNTTAIFSSQVSCFSGNPEIATASPGGMITAVVDGTTQVSVSSPNAAPLVIPVPVDTSQDPAPVVAVMSPQNGAEVERGHGNRRHIPVFWRPAR